MKALTDGPLVYIEDDEDDQFLFERAIKELNLRNQIHFFFNGQDALHYLETTEEKPLLILCDIMMPVLTGLELRQMIDQNEYLKQKAIPFIFYTTSAGPELVQQAYNGTIQGFHIKAQEYVEFKEQINLIINYWKSCLHPNSF
ncbi:hypothetical protein GCM10028805_45710 [Spirosoma harenae]